MPEGLQGVSSLGENPVKMFMKRWASQVALVVKNPPPMQEMRVPSLGREDPLEEEMATHSSILAWEILWTGEPSGLQSMGSQSQTH